MISALLYLHGHSLRNRLGSQVRRLKQPKYLAGAIVGGLYFYWYFFRFLFNSPGRADLLGQTATSENRLLLESLGALVLFVIVLLNWLLPHKRAALTFTEAEVAFLFPAPVSRQALIHFKLIRSQIRILFSVFILTLVGQRFGGNALIHAAGWWLLFSTLSLHFLGLSFARTMLLDRGFAGWTRRLTVFGVLLAGAVTVAIWARGTMPQTTPADLASPRAFLDYAHRALNVGPGLYLLYPFRLAVRPLLAPDAQAFFWAAGPALLLFALHYWWVIRSDIAFEEASVEASRRLAATLAAARAGNWSASGSKRRSAKPWFKLAATGPPATALFWKNLVSAGQIFTLRMAISIALVLVFVFLGVGRGVYSSNVFMAMSIVIAVLLFWSVLIGPQVLRQDLRQDLELADVLKSYPIKRWQIVLGELLAPAVMLSVAQWCLLMLGAACLLQPPTRPAPSLVLAITAGAAVLCPMFNLILLLIPNAAVLLFPSWIQIGREGPRGVEATGQRIIFMLGQLVVFAVTLVPAGVMFALAFFLAGLALGHTMAIPLASLAAALVLAVEAGFGVMLLGRLFEGFDLSVEVTK
jgi:hypothetical protein